MRLAGGDPCADASADRCGGQEEHSGILPTEEALLVTRLLQLRKLFGFAE
jgi:hypothetical protein